MAEIEGKLSEIPLVTTEEAQPGIEVRLSI